MILSCNAAKRHCLNTHLQLAPTSVWAPNETCHVSCHDGPDTCHDGPVTCHDGPSKTTGAGRSIQAHTPTNITQTEPACCVTAKNMALLKVLPKWPTSVLLSIGVTATLRPSSYSISPSVLCPVSCADEHKTLYLQRLLHILLQFHWCLLEAWHWGHIEVACDKIMVRLAMHLACDGPCSSELYMMISRCSMCRRHNS